MKGSSSPDAAGEEFVDSVSAKLAARRRERELQAGLASPAEGKGESGEAASGLEKAACVLAWHDPAALEPLGGTSTEEERELLRAHSVEVTDAEKKRWWSLRPSRRIVALRQLRETGEIGMALALNRRPDDPVQTALEAYLMGNAKPVAQQSLAELGASFRVCEWLRAAGFEGTPSVGELGRRADWLTLLGPFEHLASDKYFRGRTSELRRLRSYAGILPPGSIGESFRRTIEQVFKITEKPPLLITGPGGVGKSTLLARFILEHMRAHEVDGFPFIYLDFDRADVEASEPMTLLIEGVRQLAIQYPQASEQGNALRKYWAGSLAERQSTMAKQSQAVRSGASIAGLLETAIHEFALLVSSLGAIDRPILFVLDTFEEVQYQSATYVAGIWSLLESLQAVLPRLRVVVAGRADVEGWKTETLELTGLDHEAAVGYLRAHGIQDQKIAGRLAQQVGGSPLSLKLAVELAKHEGLDQDGVLGPQEFFLQFDAALLQRHLYKRVLDHVHDAEVRKLAYPGLVLRRVTPSLIMKVLAQPCGIPVTSLKKAEALFEKLKQEVALVSAAPDGAVQHRPDLRLVMLQLIRADDPNRVETIHRLAVDFYRRLKSPSLIERAEEIYHRLQLDEDAKKIDERWIEGVDSHLAGALKEFSGRRRAYLASRLGVSVDEETRKLADLEVWEDITEREVVRLLEQDDAMGALSLMGARSDRSSSSALVFLEARALASLTNWEEARSVLQVGFEQAAAASAHGQAVRIALHAAEITLASGRPDLARSADGLLRICMNTAFASDRFAVLARRIALAGLDQNLAHDEPELQQWFREAFDALPDDQLAAPPRLLGCWAVAGFRQGDASRLARVLLRIGLPEVPESELRELGVALVAFDVDVSYHIGAPVGWLAGEAGVSVQLGSSLTAAWSNYLVGMGASTREVLAKLFIKHAERVPPRIFEVFANIMLVSLGVRRSAERGEGRPRSASGSPRLSRRNLAQLHDVLMSAFSYHDLALLVRLKFDRNIEAIALPNGPFSETVLSLIVTAQREGWLSDLIAQAYFDRPHIAELRAFAQAVGITGFASTAALERFAEASPQLDISSFTTGLDQVAAAICRIEIGDRIMATGFLIEADLLLTADFVVSEVISGAVAPSDVVLRFDYRESKEILTSGTSFRLERDWLVASSRFASDGPGYALIRIAGSPGAQPVGGGRGQSQQLRGWLPLVAANPAASPESQILVIGHPDGGPLRLSLGKALNADELRIEYDAPTLAGSSGAPCLDTNFQLLGMHIGNRGRTNFGVRAEAIALDLDHKGLGRIGRHQLR